jgi:hypothetical protein
MPLWAWGVLFVVVLLALGWNYDRKRRKARVIDESAPSPGGRNPIEARRDANAQEFFHGGGVG